MSPSSFSVNPLPFIWNIILIYFVSSNLTISYLIISKLFVLSIKYYKKTLINLLKLTELIENVSGKSFPFYIL